MPPKSISVFFPAYNDAGTIPTMVIRAAQTLADIADDYEMLLGTQVYVFFYLC